MLPGDAFYLGAIGKLLATSITYPYITIKSRMHVAGREAPQDSIMGSLKKIVREEGWAGLYKGMLAVHVYLHFWRNTKIARLLTVVYRTGIGPKITQSVITAAFLFAFKDALYAASLQARKNVPKGLALK